MYIPQFQGPQDFFLNRSPQVKAILKANCTGRVALENGAASFYMLHQVRISNEGLESVSDPEYAVKVPSSIILQCFRKVPFMSKMQYQEYPRNM